MWLRGTGHIALVKSEGKLNVAERNWTYSSCEERAGARS